MIGFLLRKVVGRHTRPGDVKLCKAAVSKLHGLKILNRDLNKYNFLVQSTRAFLIDFESATKMEDQHALDMELESLEGNLTSNSTRGGNYNVSEALV